MDVFESRRGTATLHNNPCNNLTQKKTQTHTSCLPLSQMQSQMQSQAQARRFVPISLGTVDGPEYGTLAWATAACFRLAAPRVLHNNDHRRGVLASMVRGCGCVGEE